ncbi:hypothetical protein GCM10029964_066070 [Kibdelosporangium lantanae]
MLGVPRVGVEDNFFGLGGDSILSIQLVSRARAAGMRLTSRDVFTHQTVAELATTVHAVRAPALAAEVAGPAPLGPIQRWFFETHGDLAHYTMSVLLDTDVPPERLRQALEKVVAHHPALRTSFVDGMQEPGAGGLLFETDAPITRDGLDLRNGPLVKAVLNGRELFIAVHHLVVDGVSWRILLEDLEAACAGRDLAPVATPFTTWTRRLTAHVEAGGFQDDLAYWQSVTDTDLPVDLAGRTPSRPPARSRSGSAVRTPTRSSAASPTSTARRPTTCCSARWVGCSRSGRAGPMSG